MEHDKKTHAIEHFRKGCTWAEVATACGIGRTTLWRWAQTDGELATAIREAKADPDLDVEAVTFQNACDPDPAHNTLRMFWLKSRMPKIYKERYDVSTSGTPPMIYIERANNPRDAEGPRTNGTVFHMPDNGRDTAILLPAKEAESSIDDGEAPRSSSSPIKGG